MPRRGTEVAQLPMPPKKKTRLLPEEPVPSLDVSFFDDEALPPGIVFNDLHQKKWRIGKPIGRGSFGRIYLASDEVGREVTQSNARYVVKIEPHTNGPLFVEIHCLIRSAQVSNVQEWRKKNKLKRLGMPVYISSGSFTDENTGTKYRFLVLPRYDIDLQKIIARTRVLDLKNVLVLAIQILDVLEYLHDKGYTHSDIKSSNLMLGFDGGKLGKGPVVKSNPTSFQKETKEVAVLSGKHRKVKVTKSRSSNYYDDEDFVVNNKILEDGLTNSYNTLDNVKKIRKILSDKDSRSIHRHHAFNLRQLSNCVNYEDMSSSVCSDQSYQKLLDDFGNMRSEFLDDVKKADIKLQNGSSDEVHKEAVLSQSNGQIYLLDYGLASKFLDAQGKHKEFAMDARKAHDGTLEYSSRDSHIGAHSRRSDLETLGYNLLDWLTGTLPWKTTEVLAEPEIVHALKKNFMGNVQSLLKACFKTEFYPQFMEKYLEYVTNLNFTEKPDYDYCRSLFKSELLKGGYDKDAPLNFIDPPMSPMHRKLNYAKKIGRKNTPKDFLSRNGSGLMKAFERENVYSLENDLKLELLKQTLNSSSDGIRKPCTSRNFFISDADLVARLKKSLMPHDVFGKKLSPKNLRSTKKLIAKRRGLKRHRNSIGKFGNFMGSARQFTWAEILAGNPEDIIRKERNVANDDDDDESNCKYRIRKLSNASSESNDNLQSPLLQKDYLQDKNPTSAMKEVIANLKKRIANKNVKDCDESLSIIEGYTPAMVKVYKAKEKREAKEKQELAKQTEKKELPVRATRSGKTKTQSFDTDVEERKTRGNRKKTSVDSKEEINIQDNVVAIKTNEKEKPKSRSTKKKTSVDSSKEMDADEATVQNNEKVKPKCTRTVTRKEVKFEIPKATPVKNSKKTHSKTTAVPNNRRRLRSSKRVK